MIPHFQQIMETQVWEEAHRVCQEDEVLHPAKGSPHSSLRAGFIGNPQFLSQVIFLLKEQVSPKWI
jgi:hypothetical protein